MDNNVKTATTILDSIKNELNEAILNNPRFIDLFSKELNYYYYKTHNFDVDVKVGLDGKSIDITSINPVFDCSIPEFKGKNRAYLNTKFYLKDDNLIVEYNQGVLFDKSDLKESGLHSIGHFKSTIETLYLFKSYNKYGIEFSNSSYSDNYPLNTPAKEVDIREQTLSSFHRPTFNEYLLPKLPIHIQNANVRNTYRKEGSYAVIHTNVASVSSEGYKKVSCALFTTHFMFPEMLRGDQMIAKAVENKGKYTFVIEDGYAKSIAEGYERAKTELKEAIEKRKNEYDEKIYEYLYNNI